jgi:hypothetical protein
MNVHAGCLVEFENKILVEQDRKFIFKKDAIKCIQLSMNMLGMN